MLEDRLRAIPFFRAVPAADLAALAASLRREVHAAGTTVFREGDAADALYLVDDGSVEVRRGGEPLAVLGAGSFVGELGLLLGEPRSADLVARTEVSLSALTRPALEGLLESHPALGLELSRELGRRLIATNRRIAVPTPPRVVAHWGTAGDLDRLVDELRDLDVDVVVAGEDEPVPTAPTVPSHAVVMARLPSARTRASRATLRASELVVCTRRPPDWVVRRHDPARVLRCDEGMSIERAARWVAGRAVGLALSSGGSKTVAHLGVADVLQEAGIPVDAITGSSGGALIAAARAVGFPYDRCLRHLREVADLLAVRRWDFNVPPRTGVVKGRRLRDALDRMFEGRTFADALVPFAVVATDLATGREVVLDSGPLADAMRASMGIPGAFDPWPLGGRLLVDGAIVNPMPANVLRDWGVPIVVGSMVAGKDEAEDATPMTSAPPITQTMLRMVSLMERELIAAQLPMVDLLIRPKAAASYSFDFRGIDELLEAGRRAATAALPELRRLINPMSNGE